MKEASAWAKDYLKEDVTPSNISYLVQYGKVRRHVRGGATKVSLDDLKEYYERFKGKREVRWKKVLGEDLNWDLSFAKLKERDTTKHVHRLHPYKGKFIPQLVEYFLDAHTDTFKTDASFAPGDIVLDPFLGSGTTLVQANELGMHGIGIDISAFNCIIAECKVRKHDLKKIAHAVEQMKDVLKKHEEAVHLKEFQAELLAKLATFNALHFPSPGFKYRIEQGKAKEDAYAKKYEEKFLPTYRALLKKYKLSVLPKKRGSFLDRWCMSSVRQEIALIADFIEAQADPDVRRLLSIILSRTTRSCRATTHSDLATLKEPQVDTYYCYKHKKICKPIFSIRSMLERYADDTLKRIKEFSKKRTDAESVAIVGDSRAVNIEKEVARLSPALAGKKINGIFSSPPYVGQIDYHEQHAYAYDLFGYARRDADEIGPLFRGQGKEARESYVEGIANVLKNCKKYLADDYDIFLVANDKWNLYPTIAEKAGMQIVKQYKRPVLNRTERDRNPYAEIIFHLKRKV